jgi:7-carboxy-7-deazaguanine synthase
MYSIKEIFYTLQGEGANSGRAAVFCRFAGCNLWSGREADRATAQCQFCDTDFVGTDGIGGGKFASADALSRAIEQAAGDAWHFERGASRLVVLTGGEPMLQVDPCLIDALHARDIEIAIETNGTLAVPRAIDWICVSPKAGTTLVQKSGDELKLVYPQANLDPESVRDLAFTHLYLQPMDGPVQAANIASAIAYCKANPDWRLSLQTHKIMGIP